MVELTMSILSQFLSTLCSFECAGTNVLSLDISKNEMYAKEEQNYSILMLYCTHENCGKISDGSRLESWGHQRGGGSISKVRGNQSLLHYISMTCKKTTPTHIPTQKIGWSPWGSSSHWARPIMIVGIAMLKVSKMHGANITIIKGMSAKACNTGHTCSVTVTQFGLGQVSMSTNRIARFVHVILPYVLEAWYPRFQ